MKILWVPDYGSGSLTSVDEMDIKTARENTSRINLIFDFYDVNAMAHMEQKDNG